MANKRLVLANLRDFGKEAMGPFTTSTEAYKNACERITAETKPLETR